MRTVIVAEDQRTGFDRLLAKHTLVSTSPPFMGNHFKLLSVCVFKIGKNK